MRLETNLQRQGGRSSPGFSGLLASSGSLVAPLQRWRGRRRNRIRHHQPQELTVRESGAGPKIRVQADWANHIVTGALSPGSRKPAP